MHQQRKAAALSIGSNLTLVIGKMAVGLATGSVSVISEAIHSAIDLLAAVITYFSVKEASKPADKEHSFGHGKIENIAGTVEALLIFVAAGWIIFEAWKRIMMGGEAPIAGPGMLVMVFSAVGNLFVSRYLLRVARRTDSVALKADGMHLMTDVYTSAGVFVGLLLIRFTGWAILDPLVAVFVALLIIRAAYQLTKEAFLPLMDVRIPAEEEELIIEIIRSHSEEYLEFHKLRTRKSGGERYIDLHLVVPKVHQIDQIHGFCHHISDDIRILYPRSEVMIHVEPCEDECIVCSRCDSFNEPITEAVSEGRRSED
ncbi:MAG: cation diffusion facilitator family transporter [Bacillota bacterium]